MQRTERILIKPGHPNFGACHRLCGQARRLGNCAVYTLRQRFFAKEPLLTRSELDKTIRSDNAEVYRSMPSAASAQRQTQIISEQLKSWLMASASYRKNPEKFKARPNLPGYKKRYRSFVVGRNGYKIENHRLYLTGGKEYGFQPLKIRCCETQALNAKINETVVGDVRIVPLGNSFVLELTFEYDGAQTENLKLDASAACSIDLGIDNFATMISTKAEAPFLLVKGGKVKSINQWWNKQVAELKSLGKFGHIAAKSRRRYSQMEDYLHKASRLVIEYCLTYDIGTVIIGYNPQWKTECNMGKVNNQKFVAIPHARFIDKVKYKAQVYGIKVIVREESFTSKASALDFDAIPDYRADGKSVKGKFSGNRVKRGLYRAADGTEINADMNGALNIARKELGDEWLKMQLKANGGRMNRPVSVRDIGQTLKEGLRSLETAFVRAR